MFTMQITGVDRKIRKLQSGGYRRTQRWLVALATHSAIADVSTTRQTGTMIHTLRYDNGLKESGIKNQ